MNSRYARLLQKAGLTNQEHGFQIGDKKKPTYLYEGRCTGSVSGIKCSFRTTNRSIIYCKKCSRALVWKEKCLTDEL